jgi:hypothetical protein
MSALEFAMKVALVALLGLTSVAAVAEQYGAPVTAKNPVSLDAAVKQLGAKNSIRVTVQSKVDKVCQAKGCWLGLVNAGGDVRVTFKDYAFFVPPSLSGKTVLVEGILEKVTMGLEETKHYVQDAGGDPATVMEPKVEYRIVASGVEVKS